MPDFLDCILPIAGKQHPLRLYADGALYWPAGNTLVITDPHFGKADHFRHAGIAIPTTVLDHDLARLSRLLTQSGATQLVILGDFFHSRHSQSTGALHTLADWRQSHAALDITLVQGNHDIHAGPPPADIGIHTVIAPHSVGPFACHHIPLPKGSIESEGYILAGHLHPYVVLRDRDGTQMRLASFIFGPNQAILPAFGGFTGGSHYPPTRHDRVFAMAHGEIIEIPTIRGRTTPRA